MKCSEFNSEEHKRKITTVQDSMDILSRKWKTAIILSISIKTKEDFQIL